MAGPWEKYQPQKSSGGGPWERYASPEDSLPKSYDPTPSGNAALEGFGQGVAMGYLPQLQAAAEPLMTKGLDLLTGQDVSKDLPSYIERRDENILRNQNLQEEFPVSYGAGQIGGVVASAPGYGKLLGKAIPAGTGLLGKTASAAAGGGAQGLLQNPGDTLGQAGDLQIDERMGNAKMGLMLGGGAQLGASAIKKSADVIANGPNALRKLSQGKAFKSSGAMLKDFRKAMGRGRVEQLGQEMIDSGMVQPGMTFDDVARSSVELKQKVGSEIGGIYDKVKNSAIIKVNPNDIGKLLTEAVSDPKTMPKIGAEAYAESMQKVINQVVESGDQLSDPRHLNDLIGELDDMINYSKRANDLPAVQQGYSRMRQALRGAVNKIVDSVGTATGDKAMESQLRALNQKYGNYSEISSIARDRVARESANQFFSLTDKLAGVGGAVGAGAASSLAQGDIEGTAKGLLVGGAAGLLNKGMRQYGNPILTTGMNRTANVMERLQTPLVKAAGGAAGLLSKNPVALGAGVGRMGSPTYKDEPTLDSIPGQKIMSREQNRKPAKKKKSK